MVHEQCTILLIAQFATACAPCYIGSSTAPAAIVGDETARTALREARRAGERRRNLGRQPLVSL
jgi:hypothetical protein